jgi:hypothetical protein
VIKQKIEEFTLQLEESRPDIGKRALVVSNFMFSIKSEEDEWRIDEVNFWNCSKTFFEMQMLLLFK